MAPLFLSPVHCTPLKGQVIAIVLYRSKTLVSAVLSLFKSQAAVVAADPDDVDDISGT
jgi:hypothetical protein